MEFIYTCQKEWKKNLKNVPFVFYSLDFIMVNVFVGWDSMVCSLIPSLCEMPII